VESRRSDRRGLLGLRLAAPGCALRLAP